MYKCSHKNSVKAKTAVAISISKVELESISKSAWLYTLELAQQFSK